MSQSNLDALATGKRTDMYRQQIKSIGCTVYQNVTIHWEESLSCLQALAELAERRTL